MSWMARHKVAVGAGVLVTVVVVIIIVYCTMGVDADPWQTEYRLPENVEPVHYDIYLHPDLEKGNFTGKVKIDITVNVQRTFILVHAKHLELHETKLVNSNNNKPVELKNVFEVTENEWWVIQTQKILPPGNYSIQTDFTGSLTRDIVGFYRSVYSSGDNQRYIATSKFEPTYARLAFPCFDEPGLKATFDVHLVRPTEGYIALSNMNVSSEVPHESPDLTVVSFQRTRRMSTYLAVFVVCDFEYLQEEHIDTGAAVRVYARKSQVNNTQEALSLAVNVTNYYTNYFNISYPLPKLDLIAIPDFVSGAMENWGLITFRETSLLFDPEVNSAGNKQSVSLTVAHELAHMWFGDLVTMKWWTDLWLNEGFATFMEYKGVNHAHPTWDVDTQFLVDELQSVLSMDADLSSHPVLQEVGHPDQITSIFDSISYNKGSSVIRMLENFLGEENFQQGLSRYLQQHSFSNAATSDLWDDLEKYYHPSNPHPTKNIGHIMDTWTRQEGFPLITATREGNNTYVLRQKRFLSDPTASYDPNTSKYKFRWEVPITYITSEAPTKVEQVMLWSDSDSVKVTVPDNQQWIKFNHRQVGFYRVQYDETDWKKLISHLKLTPKVLVAADRASLLNDAFSLADATELDYNLALDMLGFLVKEEAYVPWAVAADVANNLLKYLPDLAELKKYFGTLLQEAYNQVTWEVNPLGRHLTRRARVTIIDLACTMKVPHALATASDLFLQWLDSDKPIEPDLRVIVYQYGMANTTDEAVWDRVFNKYLTVVNTQDKAKLMYSLAKTPNKDLLQKYLNLAKNETNVRGQDYFTVLSYITSNPAGTEMMWDFYRNEYEYLVDRFTLNSRALGRFVLQFSKFRTKEKLDEMQSFFKKYPKAGAGEAARKQALEIISTNIKWMEWNSKKVTTWFKRHT